MTLTKHITAEQLRALDLHQGDTLRVIAEDGTTATVQIERPSESPMPDQVRSAVSEWLRTARGSVRLNEGETADDVRMAYYREKYGLE